MSDHRQTPLALNLPRYDFRIRTRDEKGEIYDEVRQKYVRLTPEEWVRQHFIQFLLNDRGAPRSLLSVEMGFRYQRMLRRADIVVYDRTGKPLLMVECKAPDVALRQAAFDQVARYNTVVMARYLVITNGLAHYCCAIDHHRHTYRFLDSVPSFEDMLSAAETGFHQTGARDDLSPPA